MQSPEIDNFVCLTRDMPELALTRGLVGVVRSQWFAPDMVYEVEFHGIGLASPVRALLTQEQIELADQGMIDAELVSAG